MATCTFFGHRTAPAEIEPVLRSKVIDLIENHGVDVFYVGNHGAFDMMVGRVLKELSTKYAIRYSVVLAYMPQKRNEFNTPDESNTLLPEGIETVPKRFAINYRNKWMIGQADYVITYVTNTIGSGAAQFKNLAEKKNKVVIELSEERI